MLSVLEKEIPKVCPQPANGQAFLLNDGKTFVVICNPGYTIVGPFRITCIDGKWMPQEPKCVLA